MLHFLQKTSFALLICLCISRPADAQKKVVLEMMRCYSTTGPSMKYLLDPNRQQVILQQLNTSLLKVHDFRLTDTAQIPIALTPNSFLISLATASAFSTLMSIIATSAPALARPLASAEQICPPPPITAAVLPTNENNSE